MFEMRSLLLFSLVLPCASPALAATGWTYKGCYVDSVQTRTLKSMQGVVGGAANMTVENCEVACSSAGYVLAGVEYSQECWCDNVFENGVTATAPDGEAGCNMNCKGNAAEVCGGSNRLNVYSYGTLSAASSSTSTTTSRPTSTSTSTTITSTSTSTTKSTTTTSSSSTSAASPLGWVLVGCYTDNVNARSLSLRTAVTGGDGAMSVEACEAACKAGGYPLAGVEYSGECYCDTVLRNGASSATDGFAQCTMPCNGNAQESCGGPNRLDLYTYAAAAATTSSTLTSTTTSRPTSTTSSTTSSAAASTTSTTTTTSRSTSTSSTSTSSTAVAGWSLLGCYADSTTARIVSVRTTVAGGDAATTVESCEAACLSAGYTLAGVEYSGECYCDTAIRNGGATATDGNAQCTMTCNGNPKETCGGPNRIDLYTYAGAASTTTATTSTTSSTTSSAAASTTSTTTSISSRSTTSTSTSSTAAVVSGWSLLGCYADSTTARIISVRTTVTGGDAATTVELCEAACLSAGYTLAGVEYSGECYCDTAIRNGGATATDGNAQCTMTCNGNPKETCGGPNRIDAYTYAAITTTSKSSTTTSSTSTSSTTSSASATASAGSYWLANITHQGVAPFQSNSGYKVFRNVKDYGAKGDGVTDDTQAINNAMTDGGRCAPNSACKSTTTTPAIVYFPAGTYILSSSIVDYYFTQLIGNPNSMPVLKATPGFTGFGLIDGDQYGGNGLGFGATNVFYRQIRNFVFDLTGVPATTQVYGVHWPTAQATSIQNCLFLMSDSPGTQHQGLFIEDGSGGFLNDLVFKGGLNGATFGNQQFTVRNLTFSNAVTAINQIWDWGWTYKSITINNCTTGLDMSAGGSTAQSVGSVTFIDSSISNTPVGVRTAHNAGSAPATAGSLILENVFLSNVPVAVQGPGGSTDLAGTAGTLTIGGWGQGHQYTPNGPLSFEGLITPFVRPSSLLQGKNYFYERSKPQYETLPVSSFLSVRSAGATGNGVTDDTGTLNQAIQTAVSTGKILFIDAGTYKVTGTINIPAGSKIVGETFPVIMGSGSFFSDVTNPQAVLRVGTAGQTGSVELSDFIVATQGGTAGATLIEWNLAAPANAPSGMWDVHTRIGGFAGSNLQVAQCPVSTTTPAPVNVNCIAAFMSMHVTKTASGLYIENSWQWVADHDIEDPNLTRVTIFAGRGLYIESQVGNIWLLGTAVEHHTLYQYQFASTTNVFMGQIQTETAYYQPNPPATSPFASLATLNDPNFSVFCSGKSGNCASGWGLRVLGSDPILVYGAGLYSFFSNYGLACSSNGAATCQTQIFGLDEGGASAYSGTTSNVYVYNLNIVGSTSMVDVAGTSRANFADNIDVYPANIALFRTK